MVATLLKGLLKPVGSFLLKTVYAFLTEKALSALVFGGLEKIAKSNKNELMLTTVLTAKAEYDKPVVVK